MFHGRDNVDVGKYDDKVYEVVVVDGWYDVVMKGGWYLPGGDDCGRYRTKRELMKALRAAHQ